MAVVVADMDRPRMTLVVVVVATFGRLARCKSSSFSSAACLQLTD